MNGTLEMPAPGSASAYLDGLTGRSRSRGSHERTPHRMAVLLAALGDPHRSFPVVHVTGTNGKGSTAAMIAALLGGHDLRVGSYASPHVDRLNERVILDGTLVEDDDLDEAVDRVARAASQTGVRPSWFEAVTAAALWLLAADGTEVAVVEVGVLGRWDATNVCDGEVAVVTNVGLDHTALAGPTRRLIAAEKAGIVKPGATLVLGEPDRYLRPVFEAQSPARTLTVGEEISWRNRRPVTSGGGSVVDLVNPWGERRDVPVGMAGTHQCTNALLALTAAEAFLGAAVPDATVDAALAGAVLPGRFEVVHEHPTVVLDGAHNPTGADAVRRAVEEFSNPGAPLVVLCGALVGRDPAAFLRALGAGSADLVVATQPRTPRALPAEDLAEAARALGAPTVTHPDPERALDAAMAAAGRDGIVVATGSLHLVGDLRTAARRGPLVPV